MAFDYNREPEAARLRREGKLWPQMLSDAELQQEFDATKADVSPISTRMLRDELQRRSRRVPAAAVKCCDGNDPGCPTHGIGASNARENNFYKNASKGGSRG